ncbi:MAG: hypothetical protein V4530_01760 [Pseudomonadota bacterium]
MQKRRSFAPFRTISVNKAWAAEGLKYQQTANSAVYLERQKCAHTSELAEII